MIRTLDVYLHDILAGRLIQDESGQISFTYEKFYLNNSSAMALSQSLPLRSRSFDFRECSGFFSGILPEGDIRRIIASNLGISSRNDFSMLEKIGGECAGAITFIPSGQALETGEPTYKPLSTEELNKILKELPHRPLMAGEMGIRLSLAGVQEKLAVFIQGDVISLPLGNSPSTHILKPAIQQFNGIVFNEFYCMHLAATIGLHVAKVETRRTADVDYILVERYDRLYNPGQIEKNTIRLHQEDFCQALGIVSEKKYQKEGGPSLINCFNLLRDVSSNPVVDLQRLLDGVIFNYMVGNCDAHGKNFSILFLKSNQSNETSIRLAPLYDIVSTQYYPQLDKHLAMEIGGKYILSGIHPSHFFKLAEDAGLSKPLLKRRVIEIANLLIEHVHQVPTDSPITLEISELITTNSKKVIEQFKN